MTYVDWDGTPIVTTAGDAISWSAQVRDGDGDVVDITGWTFGFFAVEQEDPENEITITNASFTITDAGEGQVKWAIPAATTSAQDGLVFRGELWRLNSGFEKCLCAGNWEILPSIRS